MVSYVNSKKGHWYFCDRRPFKAQFVDSEIDLFVHIFQIELNVCFLSILRILISNSCQICRCILCYKMQYYLSKFGLMLKFFVLSLRNRFGIVVLSSLGYACYLALFFFTREIISVHSTCVFSYQSKGFGKMLSDCNIYLD